MRTNDEQIAIRLPKSLVKRIDEVARLMTGAVPVSRAAVVRLLVEENVAALLERARERPRTVKP